MVIIRLCCYFAYLTSISGYELLEGHYVGEHFVPNHIQSLQRSSASKLPLEKLMPYAKTVNYNENEKNSGSEIVFSLIDQLSSAIHSQLQATDGSDGNRESTFSSRSFASDRESKAAEMYYDLSPRNQEEYHLPECAKQQVCNAVYLRLNITQALCSCASELDPCSSSYFANDEHTLTLKRNSRVTKAITLVKTCEKIERLRGCRKPRDWSLLALQNTRTGKAHYLVICKCPDVDKMVGPLNHDQPTYAQVPGIRVYGMMCNLGKRRKRSSEEDLPPIPWEQLEPLYREEETLARRPNGEPLLHL